jgi:ankyrin repeat protein
VSKPHKLRPDVARRNPLHYAASADPTGATVDLLLKEVGAHVDPPPPPPPLAACSTLVKIADGLLAVHRLTAPFPLQQLPITQSDADKMTPLHMASYFGMKARIPTRPPQPQPSPSPPRPALT